MPRSPYNKDEINQAFYTSVFGRYKIILPNVHSGANEMDLAGVRKSGFVDEIELKLTVSDFKNDFKKTAARGQNKHQALAQGKMLCNYFSFLIPKELQSRVDIPEYAGLYVFWMDRGRMRVSEVKTAPRLHNKKASDSFSRSLGIRAMFRFWDRNKSTTVKLENNRKRRR